MTVIFALAALLIVTPGQKGKNLVAAGPAVRVYVFTGPVQKSPEGFVDADAPADFERRNDSVKDLREQLRKRKPGDNVAGLKPDGTTEPWKFQSTINVVDSAEEADITLEVTVSALVPSVTNESHTDKTPVDVLFGGVTTTTKQEFLPMMTTKLQVRGYDYSTNLGIQRQAFWTVLADYIVTKLDKWIQANAAQLSQRK